MFSCQFVLKKDKIPTVQLKNNLAFVPTEYITNSGGEYVTMCMTNIDLELFFFICTLTNMSFSYF